MAQVVSIPLSTAQAFPVSLMVDGNTLNLNLKLRYSKIAGYWLMAVYDAQNNLLLDSIPLVTGDYPASNVLGPYGYLRVGSCFVINLSSDPGDLPDSNGFTSGNYQLVWSDTAL